MLAETSLFTHTILLTLTFLLATRVRIDSHHVSHQHLLVQAPACVLKACVLPFCKCPYGGISKSGWLPRACPYLYCRASLSAVALDSYFPTSMLILSALLLHSSRVMVKRSFWDLRCSIRLQGKKTHSRFHTRIQCLCQYFSCLIQIQARNVRQKVNLSDVFLQM